LRERREKKKAIHHSRREPLRGGKKGGRGLERIHAIWLREEGDYKGRKREEEKVLSISGTQRERRGKAHMDQLHLSGCREGGLTHRSGLQREKEKKGGNDGLKKRRQSLVRIRPEGERPKSRGGEKRRFCYILREGEYVAQSSLEEKEKIWKRPRGEKKVKGIILSISGGKGRERRSIVGGGKNERKVCFRFHGEKGSRKGNPSSLLRDSQQEASYQGEEKEKKKRVFPSASRKKKASERSSLRITGGGEA